MGAQARPLGLEPCLSCPFLQNVYSPRGIAGTHKGMMGGGRFSAEPENRPSPKQKNPTKDREAPKRGWRTFLSLVCAKES